MTGDTVSGLRDEFEALLQFLYLAPVGLVQLRNNGDVTLLNPRCAQWLMPLAPSGDLDNLFTALAPLAPDLAARVRAFDAPSGTVCEALHLPVRAGRPGGPPGQVLSLTLIRLDADRLMAVLDDITEQLRRDRVLREGQAWLHSLVRGVQDYAWVALDGDGRIEEWNDSIARLTGHAAEAVVGRSFAVLLPARSEGLALSGVLADADATGWALEEGWVLRADGHRFWGSALVAPVQPPDAAGRRGYNLIVRDISDRREALEALRRSLSCDHLTGVANRRAFFEAGAAEIERCRRQGRALSVLMVDADHFKAINDRHGHAAGDAVLRHLAAALLSGFREVDLVARLGGEEFAVLMPGVDTVDAEAAAQRMVDGARERAVRVEGHAIGCTVSIGLATLEPDDDLDGLLARADAAMYAAKAAGRDRVGRWQPDCGAERA